MEYTPRKSGPWRFAAEISADEALGKDALALVSVPVVKKAAEAERPVKKGPGRLRRGVSFLWSLKNPLKWPGAAWKIAKWVLPVFAGYLAVGAAYQSYVAAAAPSSVFNAAATCKMDIYRNGQRVSIDETFNTTYSSKQQRFLNGGKHNPALFGDAQTPDEAAAACFDLAEEFNSPYTKEGLIRVEVGMSDGLGFGQMIEFKPEHYALGTAGDARSEFLQGVRESFSGLTGYGYPNIVQRGVNWVFDETGITKAWNGAGAVATFLYPWNLSLPQVNPGAYCHLVNHDGSQELFATRWPDKKSRPNVVTAALQPNSGITAHWGDNVLDPMKQCASAVKASIDAGTPVFSAYYGVSANRDADYGFQEMGTPDPYIINSTDPKYYNAMVQDMAGLLDSADRVMTERSAKSFAEVAGNLFYSARMGLAHAIAPEGPKPR